MQVLYLVSSLPVHCCCRTAQMRRRGAAEQDSAAAPFMRVVSERVVRAQRGGVAAPDGPAARAGRAVCGPAGKEAGHGGPAHGGPASLPGAVAAGAGERPAGAGAAGVGARRRLALQPALQLVRRRPRLRLATSGSRGGTSGCGYVSRHIPPLANAQTHHGVAHPAVRGPDRFPAQKRNGRSACSHKGVNALMAPSLAAIVRRKQARAPSVQRFAARKRPLLSALRSAHQTVCRNVNNCAPSTLNLFNYLADAFT
jgi:hypothetical protein